MVAVPIAQGFHVWRTLLHTKAVKPSAQAKMGRQNRQAMILQNTEQYGREKQ